MGISTTWIPCCITGTSDPDYAEVARGVGPAAPAEGLAEALDIGRVWAGVAAILVCSADRAVPVVLLKK